MSKIKDRIEKLEEGNRIIVFPCDDQGKASFGWAEEITLKEAIRLILDHLGIDIVYLPRGYQPNFGIRPRAKFEVGKNKKIKEVSQ